MNKIRIKSTPLFKQVAAVIGEERAQIELAIAYHGYSGNDGFYFHEGLRDAFTWRFTPQGYEFWNLIYFGKKHAATNIKATNDNANNRAQ